MTDQKFKVGDKAYDFRNGWGEVKVIGYEAYAFPVKVKFQLVSETYTEEGKLYPTDFGPSLFTVEEAAKFGIHPLKKKKTVTLKRWINVYKDSDGDYISPAPHPSREDAQDQASADCIAVAVPFEITFEVDEE